MKRAAAVISVVVAGLGMCAWNLGQARTSRGGGTTAAAGQTSGQTAAPQGKRKPQAKTQPEFEAYKAAIGLTDAAALEKAADDFAAKFPDSELRGGLYTAAMEKYQTSSTAKTM